MKFKIVPKTNKENISVTYGCIKIIESYRFLSSSSEELVENLDEDDFKILRQVFPDHWEI